MILSDCFNDSKSAFNFLPVGLSINEKVYLKILFLIWNQIVFVVKYLSGLQEYSIPAIKSVIHTEL